MLSGKDLCETENLEPMPHSIFQLEPRIRSLLELGLLCLSLLWVEAETTETGGEGLFTNDGIDS